MTVTPTFESLERARSRQIAMMNRLRPLGLAIVVLVVVTGFRTHPRPGLHGEHLGILLALIAFVVGVIGVMRGRRALVAVQMPFYVALVAGSGVLVALQPRGPAFLGVFIAVAIAAMRIRGVAGLTVAALALVALSIAEYVGKDKSVYAMILQAIGVVAFYIVAVLANRLREGQEVAEELARELAASREAAANAAVLGERQRVAREMHDVLAHSLSGLALQLEGARLLAERKDADPELVAALERAHRLASAGIDEARRAVGMLRDDELPGPERLPALVAQFEHDTAIRASVSICGEERALDSEARLTLYRTAQEALTNIRKHAQPERVELRLAYEDDGARLTVEDFGAPTGTSAATNGGGYGLTGMRERAELLGGTLAAGRTGEGFRVELWVPA